MTNKIKINIHRVKEALSYWGVNIAWLAGETVQACGKTGCTVMTLYNYFNDGFEQVSADSVAESLGVSLDWLCEFLEEDDLV